jgi:hypothetical protein
MRYRKKWTDVDALLYKESNRREVLELIGLREDFGDGVYSSNLPIHFVNNQGREYVVLEGDWVVRDIHSGDITVFASALDNYASSFSDSFAKIEDEGKEQSDDHDYPVYPYEDEKGSPEKIFPFELITTEELIEELAIRTVREAMQEVLWTR